MSRSLHGIRVAHFEARRATELDGLIARHGGVPWSAPALSELPIHPQGNDRATLDQVASGAFDVVVFLTGTGTRRLLEESDRAGRLDDVVLALRRTTIIARGPKPIPVLRTHRLKAAYVAPAPHTTTELLATLDTIAVAGLHVLVVAAGEESREPSVSLRRRGADVADLQLYEWALSPTDATRIRETILEIIAGRIEAVLFTTQVQVRHVIDVAARNGLLEQFVSALREHVLLGAVGPTVEHALAVHGLHADVVPQHPKMGHLVVALADRIAPPKSSEPVSLVDYVQAVLSGRGAF